MKNTSRGISKRLKKINWKGKKERTDGWNISKLEGVTILAITKMIHSKSSPQNQITFK